MNPFSRPNFAEKLRQRHEARYADEAAEATKAAQETEASQAVELARLDKIVENSSEKNRNFFIAYLGLLIYVQAIVFSTTDLQLLTGYNPFYSTSQFWKPAASLNAG